MFDQHCDSIISKYNLDQLRVQGTVTLMEPSPNHVNVVITRAPNHIVRTKQAPSSTLHSIKFNASQLSYNYGPQ